jgi:hypothetical protein
MFANDRNTWQVLKEAFCNPYQFQKEFGRIFLWISSPVYQNPRGVRQFSWWWIGYPSTVTSSL